ncbi:uncharacterized protein LOC116412768 [Galleria mellonella]|uniref:Uncharacterized protein LOC116412768 n=1 Tax=Galleria mellonella TaxID=7137 RepID=A0ABM3MDX9_GALME|nr:uncharacterized protein LOC116412768 [Galleria mellonella]
MSSVYFTFRSSVILQFIINARSQFLPGPFPYPAPPQLGPAMGGAMPSIIPPPMGPMTPIAGPFPLQQPKIPVVVMPYYSKLADKNRSKLHRKRRYFLKRHVKESSSCDTGDSTDSSSDLDFRATRRSVTSKGKRSRQVLTPVVSYVTKDGYVVYQKKIKKEKARDWLEMGERSNFHDSVEKDSESHEMRLKDLKNQLRLSKRSRIER